MPVIMYGLPVAQQFDTASSFLPGKLAIIQAGYDSASDVYVRNKMKDAERLGIPCDLHWFPETVTAKEICEHIEVLNKLPDVTAIMVQLPLPRLLREYTQYILDTIDVEKDADCLTTQRLGQLVTGDSRHHGPCTAEGVIAMLDHYRVPIAGRHCVIVGRSTIVGKPLALMMLNRNATVTVCHSCTDNLRGFTKQADILIVAIGKPYFITADMVKPGACVVDVGITRDSTGKLYGDVDFDEVSKVAAYITPVPRGVGPVTRAVLMSHV